MLAFMILAGIPQDGVEFFEKRVRPVLAEHCVSCHAPASKKVKGGLRVDTREGLLRGGDSGPALVPGKPGESLLMKAVRWEDTGFQMPPKNRLPQEVVDDLERWIAMGAPDPREGEALTAGPKGPSPLEGRKHWAFRAPADPVPPPGAHPVDAFLASGLRDPAPEADRPALIRRVTFDLTGLPPTPA
jgi:hypothetical protein